MKCYELATTRHDTEFYRLAWQLPCPLETIRRKTASFVTDLYNPDGAYRLVGFKEIRYGLSSYDDLCHDILFLRDLIPDLKVVLNTRKTETAIKSSWWAENPEQSRRFLDRSRASFERYHREHPDHTFLIPYEDLCEGSRRIKAMFDFLGLEFTQAAKFELNRTLR